MRPAARLPRNAGRRSVARFAGSLFASIETTRAQRKLDFIPGSIEWADFDPDGHRECDLPARYPRWPGSPGRRAYLRQVSRRLARQAQRRGGIGPITRPYEIRIIGALVRLGRRDAALELLRFFLSDRRPPPWNQWPEIAWRDRKAPAHIGDLPHTWIAAEYVLAVRSLFAYERDADRSLVSRGGSGTGVDRRRRGAGERDADGVRDLELFAAQIEFHDIAIRDRVRDRGQDGSASAARELRCAA